MTLLPSSFSFPSLLLYLPPCSAPIWWFYFTHLSFFSCPLYSNEPFPSFKSKDLRFSLSNSSACTSSLNLSVRTNQPAELPEPCLSALVVGALVSHEDEANHAIATMFGQPSSVYCISSSINVTLSPKVAWPRTDHATAPNSLKFFQIEKKRSQEHPLLFLNAFNHF